MEKMEIEKMFQQAFSDKSVELSMDALDGVAGGVNVPAEAETVLKPLLATAKKTMTLEEVIKLIPMFYASYSSKYPGITMKDVEDYIRSVWDSL